MLRQTLRQWFTAAVLAASGLASINVQAANVAWWQGEYPLSSRQPYLPAGNTYTEISTADINGGALASYDALIVGHLNASDPITATTCSQLQNFLNAGKGLVSEWNGATLLFEQTDSPYNPASMSCTLFSGTVTGGASDFGSDVPITLATPSSPLVSGLANPFGMADGSEFVYRIAGYGTEWDVAGTSDLDGTVYPTVMAAKYNGTGCVALSPFDYFDSLADGSNAQILLGNMLGSVLNAQTGCGARSTTAAVPVPALSGTMLWLLSALVLLAAAPAVQRRMRR